MDELILRVWDESQGKYVGIPAIRGEVTVESIREALGYLPGRTYARNLLDNSDFTNPVNQRGIFTTSAWQLCIDRWRANAAFPISYDKNGLKLDGSSASGEVRLYQAIPDWERLLGEKVTIAAKIDGKIITATGTLPTATTTTHTVLLTNDDGNGHIMLATNNGTNGIYFYVGTVLGNTSIVVKWVALYEGEYTAENLPAYHPKGYGAELLECQRYCIPVGINGYSRFRMSGYAGNYLLFVVPVSVTMRAKPSLVGAENFQLAGTTTTSISTAGFTYAVDGYGAGYVMVIMTKNGHGLTDAHLVVPSSSAGKIFFSADDL